MVFTQSPAGLRPADSSKITVSLRDIGLTGTCEITDLWTNEKAGVFTDEFTPEINRHGAGLYLITPQ